MPYYRTQQTRGVDTMLFYCWVSVVEGGTTMGQHHANGTISRICMQIPYFRTIYDISQASVGRLRYIVTTTRLRA